MRIERSLGDRALDRMLADLRAAEDSEAGYRAALSSRIETLPETEKKVLLLSYGEQLSTSEVCEVLALEDGEVRRLRTLAVLRLRGQPER